MLIGGSCCQLQSILYYSVMEKQLYSNENKRYLRRNFSPQKMPKPLSEGKIKPVLIFMAGEFAGLESLLMSLPYKERAGPKAQGMTAL